MSALREAVLLQMRLRGSRSKRWTLIFTRWSSYGRSTSAPWSG